MSTKSQSPPRVAAYPGRVRIAAVALVATVESLYFGFAFASGGVCDPADSDRLRGLTESVCDLYGTSPIGWVASIIVPSGAVVAAGTRARRRGDALVFNLMVVAVILVGLVVFLFLAGAAA